MSLFLFFVYREQQQSSQLDIVTGFQVLDGVVQIFVIEGLREKSIKHIWDSVPKEEGSGMADATEAILIY